MLIVTAFSHCLGMYVCPMYIFQSRFHVIVESNILRCLELHWMSVIYKIANKYSQVLRNNLIVSSVLEVFRILHLVIAFHLWTVGRMLICTAHTVILLKLWSYVQVNHWCRDISEQKKKQLRGRSHSFRHLTQDKVMNGECN